MTASKIVLNAASGVGGDALNVEDVFSTYLYEGTSANQTITNDIDLDGEGGLVWLKGRSNAVDNNIYDTERGIQKYIISNSTASEATAGTGAGLTSFNSNGFTLGSNWNTENFNGYTYASWTFRKAPKFFDVVTYTGDGASGQTINHNLGTDVGAIIIKCTDTNTNWAYWHRTFGSQEMIILNSTGGSRTDLPYVSNVTDSSFTVNGSSSFVNENTKSHVAYLFAHNDGDGDFGPDGDADIIKCGSYTGNGSSSGVEVNLGFEPQWLILKGASTGSQWFMVDNMRGLVTGGDDARFNANTNDAEGSGYNVADLTSTGFIANPSNTLGMNTSGQTYIYIAIRRGTAVPESATDVFAIDTYGGTSPNPPAWTSGFPVDMALWKAVNSASYSTWNAARLISGKYLQTAATNAELSMASHVFDYQNGWNSDTGSNSNSYSWMWKRAPNFFDVVAYTGNGTAGRTVAHNLGVAPEMMWVKPRSAANPWQVYHSATGNTKAINFDTGTGYTSNRYWNNTTPSASEFTLGNSVGFNGSGVTYVAYLFASLDGISKVGSYTGNGSFQTIDCGFSAGSRFVLIKRTDASGDWYVWDSERGITQAADPYLELNTTAAQTTGNKNYLYPASSGFGVQEINGTNNPNINVSSATYIFYAIA